VQRRKYIVSAATGKDVPATGKLGLELDDYCIKDLAAAAGQRHHLI
jgi:hypothetical protein